MEVRQPLSYWRKSVTPEVAKPPPLEVTVTRFGAVMFEKVMENVPEPQELPDPSRQSRAGLCPG